MHVVLELVTDDAVHVDQLPVFIAHALGKPRVATLEVLVPVECYVRQPTNFLRTIPTKNGVMLISYVNVNFHSFKLL